MNTHLLIQYGIGMSGLHSIHSHRSDGVFGFRVINGNDLTPTPYLPHSHIGLNFLPYWKNPV